MGSLCESESGLVTFVEQTPLGNLAEPIVPMECRFCSRSGQWQYGDLWRLTELRRDDPNGGLDSKWICSDERSLAFAWVLILDMSVILDLACDHPDPGNSTVAVPRPFLNKSKHIVARDTFKLRSASKSQGRV
jgi:hypothetical protein